MSYRIYLFDPILGADPVETGREIAFSASRRHKVSPKSAESAETDLKLAATLKRQWPALQDVQFDPADLDTIGESPLNSATPYHSLFLIEPASGVRMALEKGVVEVWVPLGFSPGSARAVFTQILGCLEALEREWGYIAFDPRLNQILNVSKDMPDVLDKYRKWVVYYPGAILMDRALLDAELEEVDLTPDDRPWYSRQ
ncbi:MAG TPA: hypothetical protein VFW40_12580 [Capsulimonadaceae bacterium]|nr:hypothetical protein [Capsulimonadaceae bacterium]